MNLAGVVVVRNTKNAMANKKQKEIVVVVSGGFDPIHPGHVRLFQEAKKLGTKLVVLLNNDNWLKKKKGYVFMSELERKEVVEAINGVDEVVLTNHPTVPKDMSVCADLAIISPDIFANGGDRDRHRSHPEEMAICKKISCKVVFNVGHGGKVQSSSHLVANFAKQNKTKK